MNTSVTSRPADVGDHRERRLAPAAIAALVALSALAVWLILDSDRSTTPEPAERGPVALTAAELATTVAGMSRPVYWAGPRSSASLYELTERDSGISLRYLPDGAEANDPGAFLTIASYPMADAFGATRQASQSSGTVALEAAGGGVAMYAEKIPQSVFVAYPGWLAQVEVYDPDPAVARRLATSGIIRPVSATP